MKQSSHCARSREERARQDAQALLQAGRALSAGRDADGEPMRRYTYPVAPASQRPCQEAGDPVQTRILETLMEQNQLLTDLIAAVNSLTSAVLATLCRNP